MTPSGSGEHDRGASLSLDGPSTIVCGFLSLMVDRRDENEEKHDHKDGRNDDAGDVFF